MGSSREETRSSRRLDEHQLTTGVCPIASSIALSLHSLCFSEKKSHEHRQKNNGPNISSHLYKANPKAKHKKRHDTRENLILPSEALEAGLGEGEDGVLVG